MADINGTETADTLDGTNSDDVIDALGGDDQINGGQGNDRIDAGLGNDTVNGGQGSDTLRGDEGNDRLTDNSDGGDDKLSGGAGDDVISISRTASAKDLLKVEGGAGNDAITYTSEGGNNSKLDIDAGSGADIINVESAKEVKIDAGSGDDVVDMASSKSGRLHAGGGADTLTAAISASGGQSGVSSGKGVDNVTLNLDHDAHFRLKLGEGQDVLTIAAHSGDAATDPLVKIKDFVGGAAGDKVNLDAYLTSVLTGTTGANAFADGHLRLIQDGDDAHLQIDLDGAGAGSEFTDLIIFQNADAATFTEFNFDGLDPTPDVSGLVV
jgi:Ca2+-binding RTX toxin-like protein